jgi:hypothetical protein
MYQFQISVMGFALKPSHFETLLLSGQPANKGPGPAMVPAFLWIEQIWESRVAPHASDGSAFLVRLS